MKKYFWVSTSKILTYYVLSRNSDFLLDMILCMFFSFHFPQKLIKMSQVLKAQRQIWDVLQEVSSLGVHKKNFSFIWHVVFKLGYVFCQES